MDASASFPMVRDVPYMGVIWVVHEASKLGFRNGHPEWCNLGQGQPEVGDMPGAPARIQNVLSYAALSCAADAASMSSMLTP